MKNLVLFFKSHIDTYTRKDGTVVQAHEDSKTKRAEEHLTGGGGHEDHALLALIATGRSGGRKEAPFKKAGYLKSAKDGWTDITPKGERFLQSKGYGYDPKKGWVKKS